MYTDQRLMPVSINDRSGYDWDFARIGQANQRQFVMMFSVESANASLFLVLCLAAGVSLGVLSS
jgi:hypothetical protein